MSRWWLSEAARVVRAGGVIAYPTEAVYGLGCDPFDEIAVLRLLALKRRPVEKGLILIASHFGQLAGLTGELPAQRLREVRATWPGPTTWLLPARPDTPSWLRGTHTSLAVRVTAHPLAAELCERLGTALVSTSANRAGQPPCSTPFDVRRAFKDEIDLIVPGATGGRSAPSEIRDAVSGRVLRPGSA